MNCILLHALGQDSSSWKETVNAMDENLEIDCPDLFTLCDSEINYSNLYRGFSKYCNEYSQPLNICGLSLAGMLAINYAGNNPDKVNSLALIATQYVIPKNLMRFQNIIFKFMPEKAFKGMGISKKEVLQLTKSMMNLNLEKDLEKIVCPTLILCGEKDRANMKASLQLNDLLDNSKLKIIERAGHEVNIDNPKSLALELNAFFI